MISLHLTWGYVSEWARLQLGLFLTSPLPRFHVLVLPFLVCAFTTTARRGGRSPLSVNTPEQRLRVCVHACVCKGGPNPCLH